MRDELERLAASAAGSGEVDLKPVVARVSADLFLARPAHDEAELARFAALLVPLIAALDEAGVLALARKLSPRADLPPAVAAALAAAGEGPRLALAAGAAPLSAAAWDALAAGGFEGARLLAARDDCPAEALAALAARPEAELAHALAARPHALPAAALSRLVLRAQGDGALAERLLARPDLPFAARAALFLPAPRPLRRALLAEAAARADLAPVPGLRPVLAERDEAALLEATDRGDAAAASALLARLARLDPAVARFMVADEGGEPLVLLLRGLGASAATVARVLLRLDARWAGPGRFLALAETARRLRPAAALLILDALGAAPRPGPAGRPARGFARPGEVRPAARAAAPERGEAAEG